jgi:siderophore synthetase component
LGAKSPSAPTAATGPQSVDLNQLRSQTAQLLANFRGQLNQLLAENGIDTSQPISLQADATGGVQVTSNHPQKDAIEELLADNSELSDTFNQLQQNYALLQQASQAAAPALMPGAPQLGKSATQPGDANAPKFSIVLRNGQASVAYV